VVGKVVHVGVVVDGGLEVGMGIVVHWVGGSSSLDLEVVDLDVDIDKAWADLVQGHNTYCSRVVVVVGSQSVVDSVKNSHCSLCTC